MSIADWLNLPSVLFKAVADFFGGWSSTLSVMALLAAMLWYVRSNELGKKLNRDLSREITKNWRWGLLLVTGIVLSIASGVTTWDGLRNFTREPLLSLMVTFGIQALMLIISWLIGESLTKIETPVGVAVRPGRASSIDWGRVVRAGSGLVTGVLLAAVIGLGFSTMFGSSGQAIAATYGGGVLIVLSGVLAAVIVSTLSILFGDNAFFVSLRDLAAKILSNLHLWVMFLGCITLSVFFSWDSLYNSILTDKDRTRNTEIRARDKVPGIMTEVGERIDKRKDEVTKTFFASTPWRRYAEDLDTLARSGLANQRAMEKYVEEQISKRQTALNTQVTKIQNAEAGKATQEQRRKRLQTELDQLKPQRPGAAQEFNEKKGVVDGLQRDIDAKRVEITAEERGVEGTGKKGQGTAWRKLKAEEATLKEKLKIAQQRLDDAQKRLEGIDKGVAAKEGELAGIDAELAKLKGDADTAQIAIKQTEQPSSGDKKATKIIPGQVLVSFNRAREEFSRTPSRQNFVQLQVLCSEILDALISTKVQVGTINCDSKPVAAGAASLFNIGDGAETFPDTCRGGDKVAAKKTADELFDFARTCIQNSGLDDKDKADFRTKISGLDLNRDDTGKRFIATLNSYEDGNNLARLSLLIAIAIDGLVFMAGLIGAAAIRSPLDATPAARGRSTGELAQAINGALGSDPEAAAAILLRMIKPQDKSEAGHIATIDRNADTREESDLANNFILAAVNYDLARRKPGAPDGVFEIVGPLWEHVSQTAALADTSKAKGYGRVDERAQTASPKPTVHDTDYFDSFAVAADNDANGGTVRSRASRMSAHEQGPADRASARGPAAGVRPGTGFDQRDAPRKADSSAAPIRPEPAARPRRATGTREATRPIERLRERRREAGRG